MVKWMTEFKNNCNSCDKRYILWGRVILGRDLFCIECIENGDSAYETYKKRGMYEH